jgi:hypothetical protein
MVLSNNYLKSLYDKTNDLRFKTYYYSDNYLDYKINVPTNLILVNLSLSTIAAQMAIIEHGIGV